MCDRVQRPRFCDGNALTQWKIPRGVQRKGGSKHAGGEGGQGRQERRGGCGSLPQVAAHCRPVLGAGWEPVR